VAAEQLSELQLAFMNALWTLGEGSVAEVQAALEQGGRALAPTTVATVLRRLEAQGWVAHRERGRQFLYRAAVTRDAVTGDALARLTSSLFGGDIPALVSQLLDSSDLQRRDLEAIRALLEEKEQEESGDRGKERGKEKEGKR
jgi:BlaI family transcriptional regulator, penicillinase repressor